MSGQLQKIMHKQSSDASSPNIAPIMVKNEVDVIAYAENNQTDPSEVYYGCSSDWCDSRFNGQQGKINCGGRWHNNNKTRSTDKKTKINPLGPEGNITVCFKCGCKFHWSYDCPDINDTKDKHEDGKNGSYLSLSNIIMMNQLTKWEENGSTFFGETLGSAILDHGASGTICRTKWYECFLETLTNAQRKKLLKKEWEPLNLSMEISWTHSTRLLYHVSLQTLKSVSSLMFTSLEQRLHEKSWDLFQLWE